MVNQKRTAMPKAKKGWGCLFQGLATFFVMIIITIVSQETESPAIIHWGIGLAVIYAIWGLDWKGTRKIKSNEPNNDQIDDDEPPTLKK